jgi:succinyl-diaminopimelate desuccinylase
MAMPLPATSLDLCQALIRCPSVTPQDGGSLALLESVLKQAGFAAERVTFQEPGQPDIENLYARIGTSAPYLIFAGHTDVVPVGDQAKWRFDPFSGEITEGAIWGRGASDMKGAVAAFAMAACSYVAKHGLEKGSIGFLITGDEEGPAVNGTVKLLDWAAARGEHFDHCLVGEPTNPDMLGDMIKIGRRGSLNGTLTVYGKQGHVAYPRRAENPIPWLVRFVEVLGSMPLDDGTAHFDASNLEVVTIDVGNPAWNVIPAEAKARFNIRFNDLWTPESLAAELQQRCELLQSPLRFDLHFEPCNASAFITPPDRFTELVSYAIEAHTGRKPVLSTTGGTSDARFIRGFCPVLEFGLVGATMHMVNEHVAVADIETLTKIYGSVIEAYFA